MILFDGEMKFDAGNEFRFVIYDLFVATGVNIAKVRVETECDICRSNVNVA